MSELETYVSRSKSSEKYHEDQKLLDKILNAMLESQSNIRISDVILLGYGTAIDFDGEAVAIRMLGKGRQTLFVPRLSVLLICDLAKSSKHRLFCRHEYRFRLIVGSRQVLSN